MLGGAPANFAYHASQLGFSGYVASAIGKDAFGAGDSFTGAFAAALLQGKTIRKAHQAAVDISAYVCTQHGAMP